MYNGKNFMDMKIGWLSFFLSFWLIMPNLLKAQSPRDYEVRLSGNAYVTAAPEGATIGSRGLEQWKDPASVIGTYLYFSGPQELLITLHGQNRDGESSIEVSLEPIDSNTRSTIQRQVVQIPKGVINVELQPFAVSQAGYVEIIFRGMSKTGAEYGEITTMTVNCQDDAMVYVDDFADYWGRRGPSVHLSYVMPDEPVEWFYSEITVPEGNDVVGSYYMANGFGEGYFGMQCNSPEERRVLFSVWSPYETQDPTKIPDSLKVIMLRKGPRVHTGEFGNEGSGGQSFLRYPWQSGKTYGFLTRIVPDADGNTRYASWFFATEEGKWRLVAEFLRPETRTHYTRAHSFLENFYPEQGYLSRKAFYGNQWFRTVAGKWIPATEALFTYDATAKARARIDYQGGYDQKQNTFFLRNCGFFSVPTKYKSRFQRKEVAFPPVIDLDKLP